ncbi:MAG: LamG domain-containing protein [Candidatus Altiarchaeota archaeon]|nr:LamG domain-containing protein [Candidatus Altiarchaeota archaeon]
MKGQLSIESILMVLLAVGVVSGFFVFLRGMITDTQAGAEKALIYPEQPPQILTTRCFLDHGYVVIQTERLVGNLNYRIKNTAGVNVKTGVIDANVTSQGKLYFGALLTRDTGYVVEFYTTKWSITDTCNARIHDSAVSYFSFDEASGTTIDDLTTSNDGVLNGYKDGAVHGSSWATGKYDGALSFDGVDNFINVTHASGFDVVNITVSAWIKTSEGGAPHNPILSKYVTHNSVGGYYLRLRFGQIGFLVSNGTTYGDKWGGSLVNDSLWHHVVGTFNGTFVQVYLDGSSAWDPDSWPNVLANPTVPFRVGRGGTVYDNSLYFNGTLDDVKIFNRALNSTEVASLYQNQNITDGLIAYWPFDEGVGSSVFDDHMWTSGKINTGINFNGVDDYIDIPDSSSLDTPKKLTITSWVYANTPSVQQGIISKGLLSSSPRTWDLGIDASNQIFWYIANSDSNYQIIYADSLGAKTWQHIAASFDGTDTSLYVNGQLKTTETFNWETLQTSDTSINIGKLRNQANYFDGKIDELYVYNGALSSDEIYAIYEAYN